MAPRMKLSCETSLSIAQFLSSTLLRYAGRARLSWVAGRSVSKLRVDRQELQQVCDKAPAHAGFGLVPVAHLFAVFHCLPDYIAVGIEEDAVAVGGYDAGRHVG